MGDHDIILQALTNSNFSRADTNEIFELTKLSSFDNEDEENPIHPNVHDAKPANTASVSSLEPNFSPLCDEQVRKIMALRNPLLIDEEDVALPEKLSNAEWIEYLERKGPYIVTEPIKNRDRTSMILRKLGGEIKVLPPGNNAELDGDWTNDKFPWRKLLSVLASELKTVEEHCSSEVRDSGLFVLSKLQFPVLLELMAQEIENGPVVV